MRKFSFLAMLLLLFGAVSAQIPGNYYNNAKEKKGRDLQRTLSTIISNDVWHVSYGNKENAMIDLQNNGFLWDIYSHPCCHLSWQNFGNNTGKQCVKYSFEHIFCKDWFNEVNTDPYSDMHHIFPVDANINGGYHSNVPYGEVFVPRKISQNGTKWGYVNCACANNLFDSTSVFEPVDEFKGDVARALLYMSIRYMLSDDNFFNSEMTVKSQFRPWALEMLKKWHLQDPVSTKEIERNEKVYAKQHNANPLIDHPELVTLIWGSDSLYGTFGNASSTSRPKVIALDSSKNSITITFDTPMQKSSAENVGNYSFSGGICIDSVSYDNNRAVITLGTSLVKGTPYHLYIRNVKSENGVYVTETVKNFVFGRYPSTYVMCGDPDWYPREVLVAWTFDDLETLPSPIVFKPNEDVGYAPVFQQSAIYADGSYGSSSLESGVTIKNDGELAGDPRVNAVKSQAFNLKGAVVNGKSIVVKFSTKNWQEIMLTFATFRTSTGAKKHLWEWSLDGENYDTIANSNTIEDFCFLKYSVPTMRELDLRELDVEDKDSVFLRLTVSESTGSGTNTFDNFVIYGERYGYTSIRENTPKLNNIQVVPNPNNGTFSIHDFDETPYTEAQIFDITGRLLIRQDMADGTTTVNMINQPNGIYFVKIVDKKQGAVATKKIIVSK